MHQDICILNEIQNEKNNDDVEHITTNPNQIHKELPPNIITSASFRKVGEAETSDVSILLPKSFVLPNSPDIYQPQNEEFVENESIEEKSRKFVSKKSPRVRKNAFSCVENFDKETFKHFEI